MSVLKSQRGQSGVQFLDTAYDLHVMSIRNCLKIPKRLTFYLSTDIVRAAADCHSNVKAANSIFPSNQHEAQLRRDYLIKANSAVQTLYSLLDILWGFHAEGITERTMEIWIDTAAKEAKLIAGIKESDKKRFANLAP